VTTLLVEARRAHPTWGPHKLKAMLERQHSTSLPAPSTIGDILKRHGLVEPRKRRRCAPPRATRLREATAPNDIWCVDYKGQFRMGKGGHCYPLTLTDQHTRYLLSCEAFSRISTDEAQAACTDAFRRYGLPEVIRSDNGAPFASTGLAGLSTLSVWWLRLGITLERIDPGKPQQNGRHERMHRTLKRETARPARANLLQQQERFDHFVDEFNLRRPHQALGLRCPADLYVPSTRPFPEQLEDPEYPTHDDALAVHRCGHVFIGGRSYFLTRALAHQVVGVREEDDGRWLVSFLALDLGHIDLQLRAFVPMEALPPQS
jgi:transposase InsO family protein